MNYNHVQSSKQEHFTTDNSRTGKRHHEPDKKKYLGSPTSQDNRGYPRPSRDLSGGSRDHSGNRGNVDKRPHLGGQRGAEYRTREEPQSFEIETEELDPRVQQELEKLNSCTDEINRLEVQLDDANTVFRSLLSNSTHHLKSLSKKLGSCIEKARPYYEALSVMMMAQAECQKAAVQFQRAAGIHAAAKETISLAEERFLDNSGEWQFDNAWQEMLNHATIKVMDAEKQRTASEKEHLARSAAFTAAEASAKALEKKLSRHIEKSKPYFEQKDTFNKALNSEKTRIQALQAKICQTKSQYAQSLRNLEDISESIHERRKYSARQYLEADEVGSLNYDLNYCHLEDGSRSSIAGSQLTLSENSTCDSALGSASMVGEGSTFFEDDRQDESKFQCEGEEGRTTVSRSYSLPNQLANLARISDSYLESHSGQKTKPCQQIILTKQTFEIKGVDDITAFHEDDIAAAHKENEIVVEITSNSGEKTLMEGDETILEDTEGIKSISDYTPIKL